MSDDDFALLAGGVFFIHKNSGERITKYRDRFAKTDAVLSQITDGFSLVPFKDHGCNVSFIGYSGAVLQVNNPPLNRHRGGLRPVLHTKLA